jgi:hypothetical protein
MQYENLVVADTQAATRGRFGLLGVVAWTAVGIPFAIGLWSALRMADAVL